ncbi:hypothetical protein N7G274_002409 [Stereocaulon virgatum]|uniref:Zn(2)-C6 fungal-type domain-containing protein n=1 Tax=Stereocaulon virgatum TaxID=373712 RepID=A0ABR4AIJ7_9LECA
MSLPMYTVNPRRSRTPMPRYNVLEPEQCLTSARDESRYSRQAGSYSPQTQYILPRWIRDDHDSLLGQKYEMLEPFNQPGFSRDIHNGTNHTGTRGAGWFTDFSGNPQESYPTGMISYPLPQGSISQSPWPESYVPPPYHNGKIPIVQEQSPFHMATSPEEAQNKSASYSSTYGFFHEAHGTRQKQDQSHRQRSYSRASHHQGYPRGRTNMSFQKGHHGILTGNDILSQGYQGPSSGPHRLSVNETTSVALGYFSPNSQHDTHLNNSSRVALQGKEGGAWPKNARQSSGRELQAREELQQRNLRRNAPEITVSMADTFVETPNLEHFESGTNSPLQRSSYGAHDKRMSREEFQKHISDEGKLRIPSSPERHRKEHSPGPRTRILTKEGKEHAKQVRRVGACGRCRERKIRCDHALEKIRTTNLAPYTDAMSSQLSIESESSGHSSDHISSSPSVPASPWPYDQPDTSLSCGASPSMAFNNLSVSPYQSIQSSDYSTSPSGVPSSLHFFDRAGSCEPPPYSLYNEQFRSRYQT